METETEMTRNTLAAEKRAALEAEVAVLEAGLADLKQILFEDSIVILKREPEPVIKECKPFGSHKTGSLAYDLLVSQIVDVLKFKSSAGDPYKVTHEWNFTVDGVYCSIWDYKGTRWSTYGPREIFEKLFPGYVD